MSDEQIFLTPEQAIELLPEGDYIHTYMNPGVNMLVGADHSREPILKNLHENADNIQITGKLARGMKHGMAINGSLYIETNMEILDQKYPAPEE